jgi:potassium efflux system protein
MLELAMVAALLELIRQLFAPNGLAEAHFGWPTHATRPLHRGLLLTEAIGLPLLYVALHLAFAGIRLNSPDELQLFNNSLGRGAFIAALAMFGLSILTMLRPARKPDVSEQVVRVPWPRRFSEYAFPTAFLGAYPIVILATIVPALLAASGFYVTGLLLAYQMLRTLLLALVVMVGGGIVHRWRIVNRNRSLLDSREEEGEEAFQRELESTEKQVRHLFRFAVIAVVAIGLFSIWSDALPMLQALKRVQLLPRLELLEPVDDTTSALIAASKTTDPPAAAGAETDAGTAISSTAVPTIGSTAPTVDESRTAESAPLTLWLLLEAILAGLIALVLVKNLPGVIEITLKRRTTLDGGARFAFSTLVRYSITIIGTIVVFGLLGVTWSKVQWLAAALTFGLGFGLQEIVANFVSGLILLVERPVRVGDVVTIGTLMGKVTRIQIRATTITLWDRSEMIVPNKEFITTKLVNWTLSDSKRRIEIPVRIAYGADLEQVKSILVNAAVQHPSVLDDPAPHVLLLAFGDDAINFELRFVVDFGQGLATKDEVQMAIDRAFREGGVEFALPKSEIHLISESRDKNGSNAAAGRSDD